VAAVIEPLIRKLEKLGPLSVEDRRVLEDLPITVRRVAADCDLVCEGDQPTDSQLLLEGFACRYKTLENGGRQIMSFHIRGDICDLHSLLVGQMDHSISMLTQGKVAAIPHATILGWTERHPAIGRVLWWDTLIDAAIFREWVVNVGRRSAYQRIAHLLCELIVRMDTAGLAKDYACDLPITQTELADATGLSTVHVNRTLQELRGRGLIEWQNGTFVALDWTKLKEAAGFDPAYLHQLAPGLAI
jgi:CRP-like cAMP-binding protein